MYNNICAKSWSSTILYTAHSPGTRPLATNCGAVFIHKEILYYGECQNRKVNIGVEIVNREWRIVSLIDMSRELLRVRSVYLNRPTGSLPKVGFTLTEFLASVPAPGSPPTVHTHCSDVINNIRESIKRRVHSADFLFGSVIGHFRMWRARLFFHSDSKVVKYLLRLGPPQSGPRRSESPRHLRQTYHLQDSGVNISK